VAVPLQSGAHEASLAPNSAVHLPGHPGFTEQSLLGCASLERAARGGQQGKGAGTGVAVGAVWGTAPAGTAAGLQHHAFLLPFPAGEELRFS